MQAYFAQFARNCFRAAVPSTICSIASPTSEEPGVRADPGIAPVKMTLEAPSNAERRGRVAALEASAAMLQGIHNARKANANGCMWRLFLRAMTARTDVAMRDRRERESADAERDRLLPTDSLPLAKRKNVPHAHICSCHPDRSSIDVHALSGDLCR